MAWKPKQISLLDWLHKHKAIGNRNEHPFGWFVAFPELCLRCSAMRGKSSGSAEGSSWCHRPGIHPVSFPGFLHWPRLDLVLWPESPVAAGAHGDAPGAGLVSSERNAVDVC